MRRPVWIKVFQSIVRTGSGQPALQRDRFAVLVGLATIVCLGLAFISSKGTKVLMPGPLASAHGGIEKCSACHTKSGSGKMSWVHGLVAGDPNADSKACLTCHKMPDTAFNAHSAPAERLKESTNRLTKIAAGVPQPQSARAQNIAFPAHDVAKDGLACATCHQEHQGVNFSLNKITNEQCQSCHVVKFDSFDGHHPKFDNYPFKQRTRIIYDHASHFGKHFPEVAKKDPAKRIPETCAACHNTRADKRIMSVAPFEQTCATCHLDQINGKERVSGPKGIAFLSLPGLDLTSLKKKNAAIGEWPETSDAALTPFMKVMISSNAKGRALLKSVASLNLQDLANANDDQLKAVTGLVWEIKSLFHALIAGKASDALGDLNIGGGARLSASLVADLTAGLPRDAVASAQQQWLPNLAKEIANRKAAGDPDNIGWNTVTTDSNLPSATSPAAPLDTAQSQSPGTEQGSGKDESADPSAPSEEPREVAKGTGRDPPPCLVRVLGQCLMSKGQQDQAKADAPVTAGEIERAKPEPDDKKSDSGTPDNTKNNMPQPMRAGLRDVPQIAQAEDAATEKKPENKSEPATAKREGGAAAASSGAPPSGSSADPKDELLFPTEAELRDMKVLLKNADKPGVANPAASTADAVNAATSNSAAAASNTPVISIESSVEPENWAEYGGWYRQDFAIFYRPSGHKDKFAYSWLFLTGPQAPKGDASPAAAVFNSLTNKDAQGSCTKCHSVDDIAGKGRVVNFRQPAVEDKQGRFTIFTHEPHFAITNDSGCLTCHELKKNSELQKNTEPEKSSPYLRTYEQGDAKTFTSNFTTMKKETCQTCHKTSMARQDCLLCHKYHVNDAISPIIATKVPNQ
jgi:hypothetical protein